MALSYRVIETTNCMIYNIIRLTIKKDAMMPGNCPFTEN